MFKGLIETMKLNKAKKQLLEMDDLDLDRKIRIQGTEHDRKRRFTDAQVADLRQQYASSTPIPDLMAKYSCSYATIKYNVDDEYRKAVLARASGRHYGKPTDVSDRVAYKRKLIADSTAQQLVEVLR